MSYSLHLDQIWVSDVITIYCKKVKQVFSLNWSGKSENEGTMSFIFFFFSFEGLTFGKCSLAVSEYRPQAWEPEKPVVELLTICSECSH